MREEQAECHARVTGHVKGAAEMCSRDAATFHPTLVKANGKNTCPQQNRRGQVRLENHVLPTPGGRLKFFKDGKFILELSHRRDGERTTWFPVPKKTFWPPASTTPNRHESSTSLSGKIHVNGNLSITFSPIFNFLGPLCNPCNLIFDFQYRMTIRRCNRVPGNEIIVGNKRFLGAVYLRSEVSTTAEIQEIDCPPIHV